MLNTQSPRSSETVTLNITVAILAQVAVGRQLHSGLSQGGHLIWIKLCQSVYVAFGLSHIWLLFYD